MTEGHLNLTVDEADAVEWVLDRLDEEWASSGEPQHGSQRAVLRAALQRRRPIAEVLRSALVGEYHCLVALGVTAPALRVIRDAAIAETTEGTRIAVRASCIAAADPNIADVALRMASALIAGANFTVDVDLGELVLLPQPGEPTVDLLEP